MNRILQLVHDAAKKKILFLPHAVLQMSKLDRMISTQDIKKIVFKGELIEDYPEDRRGHSYLMLGYGESGRPLHIVCAPKKDFLTIITAYIPSLNEWKKGFRERR